MGREIGAQFFRVRAESAGDPGKDGHGIGVIEGKADHGHSDVRLPAVKGRVDFPWLVHPEQAACFRGRPAVIIGYLCG
ncbi:hypothetical protein [Streptomyces mirabilis]|uniref:hypothetical protein n=1 Tax=Streptomyces mirabilis TaxID=68239 RepID=UPI0033A3413A